MREKLIELLKHEPCPSPYPLECPAGCKYNHESGESCFAERYADHLIANGMTIQRWIPVSERLPKLHEDVLVYFRGRIEVQRRYQNGFLTKTITHWMPLPDAPKDGE